MSSTHQISLQDAAAMTARFRNNRNTILQTDYQELNILPQCETFSASAIATLLAQEDCEAFRIYYGMDEDLKIHAILVGVNDNNADILPLQSSLAQEDPGVILEDGQRCPPSCPATSPLNTD